MAVWIFLALLSSTLAVVVHVECESPPNYVYALIREVCTAQEKRVEDLSSAKSSPSDTWGILVNQMNLAAKYSDWMSMIEIAEFAGERMKPMTLFDHLRQNTNEKGVPPVQRCLKLLIDINKPTKLRRQFDVGHFTWFDIAQLSSSECAVATLSWGSKIKGRYDIGGVKYFKIDRSGMQYFVATEGAPQVPTCPRGNVGKKRRSSSPPAERRLSASSKSHSRTRSNAEGECQIERPSPRRKSVTSKRSDRSASRESDELKSYFRQLQYLLVTSFDRNRNFDDQDDLRQELAEKMKAPAPFMTVCGTDVEMQEALNPSHPIQLHKLRDFVPLHVKGGPPEASAFYGRLEDTDAYTKISRAPNCIILQIENGEYADRRRKKNVLLLRQSLST